LRLEQAKESFRLFVSDVQLNANQSFGAIHVCGKIEAASTNRISHPRLGLWRDVLATREPWREID